MPWLIASCTIFHEFKSAKRCEERDGCRCYVPQSRYLRKVRHIRKMVLVTRASFPGYYFVHDAVIPTEIDRGHLLHIAGEYCRVSDGIVDAMIANGPYLVDEVGLMAKPKPFRRGQAVQADHPLLNKVDGIVVYSNARYADIRLMNGMTIAINIAAVRAQYSRSARGLTRRAESVAIAPSSSKQQHKSNSRKEFNTHD